MISISIPNHQRMEFILHNLYVILGSVPIVAQLLTQKLIKQNYVAPRFKSSLQKSRQRELVYRSEIFISFLNCNIFSLLYIYFSLLYLREELCRT